MMLSCASLMLKMWHRTVPEPEVVLVRAICTPFSEFTRRWPLPCMLVPAMDQRSRKKPNLLPERYLASVMFGAPCFLPFVLNSQLASRHMSCPLMPLL